MILAGDAGYRNLQSVRNLQFAISDRDETVDNQLFWLERLSVKYLTLTVHGANQGPESVKMRGT